MKDKSSQKLFSRRNQGVWLIKQCVDYINSKADPEGFSSYLDF